MYIAVIADIKKSKEIINRYEVQEQLNEILQEINKKYAEAIVSDFVITLGDEFQGLLSTGHNLLYLLLEIEQKMYPIKLRFGLGVGSITTKIGVAAIGSDGPAYHMARKSIETLKLKEKRIKGSKADMLIEAEKISSDMINSMNTILILLSLLKKDWTTRQREVICYMLLHQTSQMSVAKRFGISQSTVNALLNKGNYYEFKEGIDAFEAILEDFLCGRTYV